MKDMGLISVIIPVYNPGQHLIKCLDSIVNQTYTDLEIILVDDGSTDGSAQICDEYAERDARVKVIHQPNSGVSRARNAGIDIASGDYYYFPDSDDYIELDSFEYLLSLMDENSCDAAVFEHYVTYSDHETAHKLPEEYYGLYEGKSEIIKISFRIAFTCNKLFSKKLITGSDDSPGIKFREDIFRGEDGIFSRTVLHNADRVWFTGRPLYHYVQSEQSACRGRFRPSQLSLLKTIETSRKWFEENFPEYLPRMRIGNLDAYIMLYYDMWADAEDYSEECTKMAERFRNEYELYGKNAKLPKKQKIKFGLFSASPLCFCLLHRINEKRLHII